MHRDVRTTAEKLVTRGVSRYPGLVAPMVERLFCNQEAVGSNPTLSTENVCKAGMHSSFPSWLGIHGVLAHPVEHRYGIPKVEGSSPSDSTRGRGPCV